MNIYIQKRTYTVSYIDSNGVKQFVKNVKAKNFAEALKIVKSVRIGTNFFAY